MDGSFEVGAGFVRAVVAAGRVEQIEVDHGALDRAPGQVGAWVCDAVNAGLGAAAPPREWEIDSVLAGLVEMRDVGLVTARRVSASLADTIRTHGVRTGLRGEHGLHGMDDLVDQVMRELERLRDHIGSANDGTEDATDPDVRVTVDADGRLSSVDLSERVLATPARELGPRLVVATNAALAAATERRAVAQSAYEVIAQRLANLQETSLERMHAYARSLSALMSTIEEP
jgi:hypothetical protein